MKKIIIFAIIAFVFLACDIYKNDKIDNNTVVFRENTDLPVMLGGL